MCRTLDAPLLFITVPDNLRIDNKMCCTLYNGGLQSEVTRGGVPVVCRGQGSDMLLNILWSPDESQQGRTRSKPSHSALLHGNWQETEVLAMSQVTYTSFSFQDRNSYHLWQWKWGCLNGPTENSPPRPPSHPPLCDCSSQAGENPPVNDHLPISNVCACVWRQQGTQKDAGNWHTLLIGYYVTLLLITKGRVKIQNKVIYYYCRFFNLRYFLTYYVIYFIIDLD